MIKRLLIITVLLFGVHVAFSQQNLSDKENEAAPKTALLQAQKDYRQAVKEKNSPLLIQSLIRQIKYQALIDMDSIPPMLQDLEKYIGEDRNTVEKSILHSLIAELYQMYYMSQLSKIYNRTPVTGYIPRNMAEWTGNIYIEKIFQHALDAVKAQPQLAEVNCLDYKEIMILGKNSPALRPTMYDFLVYRSIDILNGLYNISQYYKQNPVTDNQLFAPVADFAGMTIEAKPFDVSSNIIKLYQSLLQSELTAKRADAVLISDLDRLEYIRRVINTNDSDSLYTSALEQLAHQYNKSPYNTEVLYKLALTYYEPVRFNYANPGTTEKPEYKKALDICNKGIRQYPNYFRINILKQMAQEITRTNVFYTLEPNVYPGHTQNIKLSFKNLSKISFSIYKIQEGASKNEQISTYTFQLPKQLYSQDTTLQIPVPSTGRYKLTITYSSGKQPDDWSYFNSSRLSSIARKTGNKNYNVLVCDLISGKPIQGATVKIYRKSDDKHIQEVTVKSDNQGIVVIKNIPNNRFYQVTLNEDNQGMIVPLPSQYFSSSKPIVKETSLFTDRAIYRPGQIVYFSGISWEATAEASKAVTGKKYTVTLSDVNNQVVAKEEVQTNEFGSFAGKFTLPQDVLNGLFFITAGEANHTITVAEYKRPKFEITFNPIKGAYKAGDRLTVSGIAKNYSGANAGNSKVTYSIQSRSFAWRFQENTIAAGKTQTNEKGEFSVSFDTEKTTDNSPGALYRNFVTYTVSVTVTTPNGETQESNYSVQVTPQNYRLNSSVYPYMNKEKPNSITVTTLNYNEYPLTENITYELSALKPLQKLGEEYDRSNLPVDKKVLEGTFTTNTDKALELNLSSLPSGAYLLKLSGTGDNSNITNENIIYLYPPQDNRPPYLTYFWSVEEKTTCIPGEDARILLGSSAKDVNVLYEIYSDQKLMERKRLVLNNSNTTLDIPYKEDFGKKAEVIVSFIKDGEFFTNNFMLTREEADKKLDIITKTFRDHLTPGQKEEWSFIIKNGQGNAVIAEMMAGMYDASLDKIRPNIWNFNPVYYNYSTTPRWRFDNYPLRGTLGYNQKRMEVLGFEFNRLNLYGLSQYTFLGWDNAVVAGYGHSRGGAKQEIMVEEMAEEEIALPRKVAGIAEDNDNTKFYIRGLSSFKASADSGVPGVLSEESVIDATPQIRQNF